MGVRLNKALSELNIGFQTAVDYLKRHTELGVIGDDATPYTKITDSQYEGLCNEFKRFPKLNVVGKIDLDSLIQSKRPKPRIRLNKVLTELNIGLQTAIDFLKAHKDLGEIRDDANANTKISQKQYEALIDQFKGNKNVKEQSTMLFPKKPKDDAKQGIQVVGKIDLSTLNRDDEKENTKKTFTPLGKIDLDSIGKPSEERGIGQSVTPLGKIDLDSLNQSHGKSNKTKRSTMSGNRATTIPQTKVRANNVATSNRAIDNSKKKKYDVFVSYSRRDTNRVQAIVGEIEKEGFKAWIDKKGIDSGDEFKTTIVKAIRNSEVFLFFSSKGANESTWTMKEVNTAVHFKKAIIPVKLDNTEYDDSILLELVGLDYVDFTDGTQHSYAISKLTAALRKRISNPVKSTKS